MRKLVIYATMLIPSMMVSHLNAQACFNGNLRGAYSFEASGTLAGSPFAAAGQTLYDGAGQADGVIQASVGGTVYPPALWTATYSVGPMATASGQTVCVFTKTITIPSYGMTISFFGTAGSGFTTLRFIATTSGATISGTAQKQ
jgi:hypothetical protein